MPRSTWSRRCASGSGRSSSASRRAARPAIGRRGSSGSSGSTRRSPSGHWVPEQIRRAGGWDLLGSDGDKAHPTTWDAVAEVDPEMLFLMPCGFHLAETVRDWARTPIPPWLTRAAGRPSGRGLRARRLGVLLATRSAGHRRDRAAGRDHGSGRVRRHRPARRLDAGRGRLTLPFRASFSCLWCGAAHTVRSPDDLEGWAQLCPDCVGKAGDNGFLRFRLRQALTERSAAARDRRRRSRGRRRPRTPSGRAVGTRPRDRAASPAAGAPTAGPVHVDPSGR